MVKSVKAIILASVMVSMSVMLINSCGVSSPTSSNGGNTTGTATKPNALYAPTTTPMISPIPPKLLPSFACGMSQADIKSLLGNKYANPNAKGTLVPFTDICGDYTHVHVVVQAATNLPYPSPLEVIISENVIYVTSKELKKLVAIYPTGYPYPGYTGTYIDSFYLGYNIPCDMFPNNPNLPDDLFKGNGFPPGDYLGADGTRYTKHPDGTVTATPPDPNAPRTLLGIEISPASISCSVGTTTTVTATAIYNKPPVSEDITNSIVSADTGIATITNGTLTPVQSGTTMLSVAFGGYTAFSYIDVKLPRPDSIVLEPVNYSMAKGDTKQYIAKAHYTNNPSLVIDITKNPSTNWAVGYTGTTKPADINNNGYDKGTATGLAPGTAVISASYDGVNSNNATLTVLDKKLSSISVDPKQATIYLHPTAGAQQYTAIGTFSDGSTKSVASPITWNTLPGGIANIDSTGKAIAVSPGTTYITAASDSIKSGAQDAELNIQCFNYTVHYRQNQGLWMNNVYNNYQATGGKLKSGMLDHSIGAVGCYLTSVANAMNATGTNVTPQQLNDWMVSPNDGFVGHNANANRAFDYPGSHIKAVTKWQNTNISDIKYQLSQCNIIFALVTGTTAFTGGHYVLIVKEDSSGRLMMLDPWKYSTDPAGVYYEYVDKRYTINQYQVLSVK